MSGTLATRPRLWAVQGETKATPPQRVKGTQVPVGALARICAPDGTVLPSQRSYPHSQDPSDGCRRHITPLAALQKSTLSAMSGELGCDNTTMPQGDSSVIQCLHSLLTELLPPQWPVPQTGATTRMSTASAVATEAVMHGCRLT